MEEGPCRKSIGVIALVGTLLAAGPASAILLTSADVPRPIPDLGTAVSTIVVPNSFVIGDVNAIVGDLQHGFLGDLLITLTSPSSSVVTLFRRDRGD